MDFGDLIFIIFFAIIMVLRGLGWLAEQVKKGTPAPPDSTACGCTAAAKTPW